jgi:hypothetical protein
LDIGAIISKTDVDTLKEFLGSAVEEFLVPLANGDFKFTGEIGDILRLQQENFGTTVENLLSSAKTATTTAADEEEKNKVRATIQRTLPSMISILDDTGKATTNATNKTIKAYKDAI